MNSGVSRKGLAALLGMSLVAMILPVSRLTAQVDARRSQATRAELEALWAQLKPEQRRYSEAVALRERLDIGDFQVGDKIVLRVRGDTALSDTFTVTPSRTLELPNIGTAPLTGVLRSELEDHLKEIIGRFIKAPEVRATALMRISVVGMVGRPGFYNLPAVSLMGDVFTAAGGLNIDSDPNKTLVLRGGQPFLAMDRVTKAITEGRTLDQMNLHSGDEVRVGEKKKAGPGALLVIGGVSAAILSIVAVVSLVAK